VRSSLSLLIVASLLLSSMVVPAAGDEGGADANAPGIGPMTEWSVDFSVRNTLDIARDRDVAWAEFGVPPGLLYDRNDVTLVDRSTSSEVRVGLLPGDVTLHDDGSIHRARVHFLDSWDALETKDYTIYFNRTPAAAGPSISSSVQGDFVVVNDGARQYQVHTADSPFKSPQSVYYLYILNGELRAYGTVLTRVGGNQLDPDQASFQMWWGDRTYLDIERSPLVNRVTLRYDDPVIAHWGPGGASVQEIVRYPDLISAEVQLTFYQGIPRVDVHSERTIHERFWNHNGFVEEFTAIRGDGADWQGEFETVYGSDARVVMTTTTQGPTWTRQSTQWQGIGVGSDAAPAFHDLDGDGDLDMVLGSEDQGLKVFQNTGDRTSAVMEENSTWALGLPNLTSATPTLGDLDGDGDADLLVGEAAGYLKLYRNDGGASGPPAWTLWTGNFDRLDLGSFTAPNLGDADGDGDLDIVVGLKDGTLKGIENTGTASAHRWSMDDRWVDHLSHGLTRAPCDGYSVPYMVDVDYDGDTDLLLGSDDGKVMVFENVARTAGDPDWSRLDVSYHAGVVTGSPWESNSTPTMVDIDGDGDRDLLIGNHQGRVYHYSFDGNTTPAKGHNNLQPLENGTYRYIRDKDGNDGPYVVEGYGQEFYDYYVLANPRTGYAAMRYMPDFDRLAYKQEYWGDEFQFAGGNVSYYPYEPVAKEYVTRALINSNPMEDGISAGTFISQTGSSAGFVMQPMVATTYESTEVLLLDLQRRSDPADYDDYAAPLAEPLEVLLPTDLQASIVYLGYQVGYGATTMSSTPVFRIRFFNTGPETVENVTFRIEANEVSGGGPPLHTYTRIMDMEPGDNGFHSFIFYDWNWTGTVEVKATVDVNGTVDELDEYNNNATYLFQAPDEKLPWSRVFTASTGEDMTLHADAVVRRDGRLCTVWETVRGQEEIDLETSVYDPLEQLWSSPETLVTDSHYAVEPDLTMMGDVIHLAYSSNIEALKQYHRTANAKYYWGEKFDVWAMMWDQGLWSDPDRVTRAMEADDSDQTPELVYGAGSMRMFYRNTHFQFYTGGNQMNNIPFQEMDVMRAEENGGWNVPNQTVGQTAGSQAWWSGPAAAAEGNDHVWVVYASEVGDAQWDLYADGIGTSGDGPQVRLTQTANANEFRPAIASSGITTPGAKAVVLVAYETDRNGNRDIAVRWRDNAGNKAQGWSAERLLTTDPASDMKPTVAYDGHGNYWVAWESERNGNKDIYISRFDGTDWFGPYQATGGRYDHWLRPFNSSEEEPVLACDDQTGRVFLLWEESSHGKDPARPFSEYSNKRIKLMHMMPRPPSMNLEGPMEGLEDSPVIFEGSLSDPDGDTRRVEWDWGDGNVSTSDNASSEHVYERAGTYTVTAHAVDWFGMESPEVQVTVTVRNVAPVANVTGDTWAREDAEASFSALGSHDTPSDNGSLEVTWDFDDGSTLGPLRLADEPNATHFFTSSGWYNVTVTITDDDGDTATATHELKVANWIPTVDAWTRFEDLVEDEPGEFSGSVVDTPSDMDRGHIFTWDWGDGTESEPQLGPLAVHSYQRAGTYNATLYVEDDDGDVGKASVEFVVTNVEPGVTVSGGTSVDEDEEVTLSAVGSDTEHDQALLEYQWDWGDGTVSEWGTMAEASHTYANDGSYVVTITVRDDDGATATVQHSVSVSNVAPVARAMASVQVAQEGQTVHFTAEGTTDTPSDLEGLTYRWDLGSEFVDEFEFDHVFRAKGMYSITLTVIDDDGELSRAVVDVVVTNREPTAAGWVGPSRVKVGQPILLDGGNSTDDPWDVEGLKYHWSMGDGGGVNGVEGSYAYTMVGTYNVILEVTDGDGGKDQWTTTVTVVEAGGGGDDGGGGPSMALMGGGIALALLVVILLVWLLVLRGRGGPEVEGPEAVGEAPEAPVDEEAEDEAVSEPEEVLVEEEVEVLRPREDEADPAEIARRIEEDLDPDNE